MKTGVFYDVVLCSLVVGCRLHDITPQNKAVFIVNCSYYLKYHTSSIKIVPSSEVTSQIQAVPQIS
jgi:hypothetical protein